ncbi:MAG: hypothetical protein ACRETQ_02265 [Gammaproteobacteria bacterium]
MYDPWKSPTGDEAGQIFALAKSTLIRPDDHGRDRSCHRIACFHMRAVLDMPALSAARTDPQARVFYQALIAGGKKKIQALRAFLRKYLTGL